MRAKRGSIGRREISRPRSVRRAVPPPSLRVGVRTAPSSTQQVERRLDTARVGRRQERERRDVAEAERRASAG